MHIGRISNIWVRLVMRVYSTNTVRVRGFMFQLHRASASPQMKAHPRPFILVCCFSQAFDYARSKAGNVTELFDVLAGRLRPGRKEEDGGGGLGATSLSSKSILKAQYHGSAGSTVLGMANLKRIQTFLDEPQKHLGQVMNCWTNEHPVCKRGICLVLHRRMFCTEPVAPAECIVFLGLKLSRRISPTAFS